MSNESCSILLNSPGGHHLLSRLKLGANNQHLRGPKVFEYNFQFHYRLLQLFLSLILRNLQLSTSPMFL